MYGCRTQCKINSNSKVGRSMYRVYHKMALNLYLTGNPGPLFYIRLDNCVHSPLSFCTSSKALEACCSEEDLVRWSRGWEEDGASSSSSNF